MMRHSKPPFVSSAIETWQLRAEAAILTAAWVLVVLEAIAGALTRGPA
jgi:hypothetical protein